MLIFLVGVIAFSVSAAPPCYNNLNPNYETICSTVVLQDTQYAIRDYGAGVQATIATSFSVTSNFSKGTSAATTNIFNYFLGDNLSVERTPFTVPLIFRPTPAGTWSASMVLATSVVSTPDDAPTPFPPTNVAVEEFGKHRIASYTFYTINLATVADYQAACSTLTKYMESKGLSPAAGDWAEAWVTYSTLAQEGDRINECWIEVAPAPSPPIYTSPPCYSPLNSNFETVCYTVQSSAEGGLITIRNLGVNVTATIATAYSVSTNFTNGTYASATLIFQYFGRNNDQILHIPTTVPLIFRPAPTGTWTTAMILPASVIPSPADAPGPILQADIDIEAFGNHKIAAYTFYTIYPATEADYQNACQHLTAYLTSQGLTPTPGKWAQAWVTYSTQARLGNRINECWIEVS